MNAYGKMDLVHGRIRYGLYDMEQTVDLSMDNQIIVSANQQPKLQFLLIDGDIYYNHWDPEAEAFETVNHPLTAHSVSPPTQYQPEFISATSTQTLVLNQDISDFVQEASYGTSIQLIGTGVFRFQPGTYKLSIGAGIDFLQANGHWHGQLMNHATHTALLSSQIRSQIEVSPGTNADDQGQALHQAILTFAT